MRRTLAAKELTHTYKHMTVFAVLATLRIKEGGKEGRPTLGNAQLKADLQLDTAGVGSCPLHPAQILL